MGRMLAFGVLALALAGAAWFLFFSDPASDDTSGLGDLGVEGDAADGASVAGPTLKTAGQQAAAEPTGPARFVITGEIVDAEGKPQPDLAVVVRRIGNAQDPKDPATYMPSAEERFALTLAGLTQSTAALQPIAGETTAGADGAFELKLTSPGQYRVYARPPAPACSAAANVNLYEDKLTERVVLTVLPGSALNGRVLDPQDAPVAATISASSYSLTGGQSWVWMGEPVEASGADGRFVLPAVPEGTLQFVVLLPNGRRLAGIQADTPREDEFVIRVPASGGTVAGAVTDAAGQGVAGAVLILTTQAGKATSASPGEGMTRCKAVADAQGRYRIEDAPLGRVVGVEALAEGFLPYAERTAELASTAREIQVDQTLALDVALSRGGSVHGRVLDKAGGRPIAGATVRLVPAASANGVMPAPARTTVSDSGGRYSFEAVRAGRHVALPSAPGYYLPQLKPTNNSFNGMIMPVGPGRSAPEALSILVTAEGVVVERDLELARGFEATGRVVDAAGAGVAGAEIHARGYGLQTVGWQWGLGGMQMPKEPLATSTAGGDFTIDGLPPKSDWVLFATKKAYAGVFSEPFAAGEEAPPAALTLKLEKAATVRGKVIDDGEKGIAGVQVAFWGQSQELVSGDTSVKTDAGGAFELVGVPPGDWTLNVWAQGRAGTQQPLAGVSAGEVREGIVLRIAAGVEVSGVVVDKEGEPVKGLQLMLRSLSGTGGWNTTMSGKGGQFTFAGATAGRCQVYTFSGGRQTPLGTPFDAPASDLRLEHERLVTVRIHGEVRGPDGELIPLSTVRLTSGRAPGSGVAAPAPAGMGGGSTDALNGTFELVGTGEGPWGVAVSAARDADGKLMNLRPGKALVEDPSEKVVIQLERGLEIAGVVVDASGKGVPDVFVAGGGAQVQTDAGGRFRLAGLSKATHTVHAAAPAGFVRPTAQQIEAGRSDVRFELQAGEKIVGKAFEPDGEPVKQGWVSGTWAAVGAAPAGSASAQVQSNGTFTLSGIPAGVSVQVTVQVWNPAGGTGLAPKVIENVRPGTLDLEVRLGGGLTIEGTVVGPDGKPCGGCYVYGTSVEGSKQTGYVQVKDDGAWKLTGLAPGRYKIRAMKTGGGAAPEHVEVDAPARGVRLKLPKTSSLAGRVEGIPDDSGQWFVQVTDAKGQSLAAGIVDSEGSWRVDAVREGASVWIQAKSRTSDHYALAGPIQPGRDDVVLRVKKGGTISGIVDGGPEGMRAMVWAEGARGWRASAAVTPEGTFTIRGLPPGSYTVKSRTFDSKYAGETSGVSDGAKGVRVTLSAK